MTFGSRVNRLAARVGLHVTRVRTDDAAVSMPVAEFTQLMRAYEALLERQGDAVVLPTDPLRPVLMGRLLGTLPSEAFAIVQGLARTRGLSGDVAEFGVAQGRTSALIANELKADDRTFHLFDSFEGMPQPTEKDTLIDDPSRLGSIEAYAGTWRFPEELVASLLTEVGFPTKRTRIHTGFIEEVLQRQVELPSAVSFAYLDFDFYQPIRVTLDFLDERLPVGGMVLVDDYGFFSTGAQAAVDEFVAERNRSSARYAIEVADEAFGKFATLTRLA